MHCRDRDSGAPLGEDASYTPRDCTMRQQSIDREARVFEMFKIVHEWRNGLDVTSRLLDVIKRWGQILSWLANQPFNSLDSVWVGGPLEST